MEQYEFSHKWKTRLHFYQEDFGKSGKRQFCSSVKLWLNIKKSAIA